MISFEARYISSPTIQRLDTKNNAFDRKASFIELDPLSKSDLDIIGSVNNNWENRGTYAENIFARMVDCNWEECAGSRKFFALTTQNQAFDNLRSEDILGLAQVNHGNDKVKLCFLQVDPSTNYHAADKSYKGVGSAIIESLIKFFQGKSIILEASNDAIPFYKKLGFKELSNKNFIFKA